MKSRTIIETIGMVSVVGSMLFVSVEISKNTAAVRGATQQAVSSQVGEMYRIIVENEKIAYLDVQVDSGISKSELSKTDYNQYLHFSMIGFR